MPVYQLDKKLIFPHPELARTDGLLAIGGDLSPERLLLAYANGIFPWFSHGDPILWWSPDPRTVLFPNEFKASKSLKQSMRKYEYQFMINADFPAVIKACADISRKEQEGTWITDEMMQAYQALNREGYAVSVETFASGKLVGGLYGVQVGGVFSGESMFHTMRDASKAALYFLCRISDEIGIQMIDVQQSTSHLIRLGAKDMVRAEFLSNLATFQ